MSTPWCALAQVTAQDPDNGALTVIFRSGQLPGLPVKYGYQGPADALRISQPPLPGRGTWGLVAFPNGDIRNGIWICSILAKTPTVYISFISGFSTRGFF